MNIPLEPTKPLEGVASPAAGNHSTEPSKEGSGPAAAPRKQYIPRALEPRRMWAIIRTIIMIRKDVEPLRIAQSIVPRMHVPQRIASFRGHKFGMGGKLVGLPGAGVFHGKTNVNKSITYRIVPQLDFNTERNERRRERAAVKLRNSIEAQDAENAAYVQERLQC